VKPKTRQLNIRLEKQKTLKLALERFDKSGIAVGASKPV